MAQILLLTPQLPYPPQQGTSLRNYHIICGLAQTHAVSLLSFIEQNQSEAAEAIAPLLEKCAQIQTVPVPNRRLLTRLGQLVVSRQPDMALRLASPPFVVKLREMLAERPFDIVQIEGIELAPYLPVIRQLSPQSKIIFDNHNAETELQRRNFLADMWPPKRWPAAAYSWIQVQRLRRFERWVCLAADGITVVSDADAAILKSLISENVARLSEPTQRFPSSSPVGSHPPPIVSIPNSIDVATYRAEAVPPIPFDLIFAGKMDYRPNVDAVLWFAEAVWPLILAVRPFTSWAIVGQKPHSRLSPLRDLPGVTITGWVPSMLPYWQGARIAIMPFRIGSGTRLKMIEAMAAGTPIVSTAVGAEGFPVTKGKELVMTDDGTDMATAILMLLNNAAQQDALKAAGLAFVKRYDWRQVIGRFNELYTQLLDNQIRFQGRNDPTVNEE